jgi:hypothetical protein
MNSADILSIALTSLVIMIIIHLSVFWVVRTMFPPPAPSAPVPAPVHVHVPQQVYVEPAEPKQELHVPTYEPPLQMETPRTEVPGTTDIASLQNGPPV